MAFGLAGIALGILLALLGIFLVVFFPMSAAHQTEHFSKVGIVTGIVLLVIGGLLIFI
ncbi:MAG: hypothetical protein HY367_02825 [Candidatus Aenigmarchaeota archaeon]|nr:hypothetical protein [Candidatus Aenigmarchaeota archaeon]